MAGLDNPELQCIGDAEGRMTLTIYACRKPVLAATMTLTIDAWLMSTKVRFFPIFGKLGVVPETCIA